MQDDRRHQDRREPLIPYDDEEQLTIRCENNVEACDRLLALLIKHHPEHERPHKSVKDR